MKINEAAAGEWRWGYYADLLSKPSRGSRAAARAYSHGTKQKSVIIKSQ